jgi:hypothetical protein
MRVLILIGTASVLFSAQTKSDQHPQERAFALAIRTLAEHLHVPTDSVRLIDVTPVEWRDSSLGCPERGMVYTPAVVEGVRVRLEALGGQYEVHTAGERAVVCGPRAPATTPSPPARTASPALSATIRARQALAGQLRMPTADLAVKLVRQWRATDGACEPPAGTSVGDRSHLVVLTAGGRTYRYRATSDAAWACAAPGAGFDSHSSWRP